MGTLKYRFKQGDTISYIAQEFYGTMDVAIRLQKINAIDDPRNIPAGTEIKLPDRIFHNEKSDLFRGDVSAVAELRLEALGYPAVFLVMNGVDAQPARRRFIYCWEQHPATKKWINVGILFTDDWGRPHLLERIMKSLKGKTVDEVLSEDLKLRTRMFAATEKQQEHFRQAEEDATVPFGHVREEIYPQGSLPFGFYTPQEAEQFHFRGDRGMTFRPGIEYRFVFAPLDVIRASDETQKNPRGFERPPGYRTEEIFDENEIDEMLSEKLWNAKCVAQKFSEEDLAVRSLEVWDGEKKGKKKTKQFEITMPITLPEYCSRIRNLTYYLFRALKMDAKCKSKYRQQVFQLYELLFVLDLMKKFPKEPDQDHQRRERRLQDMSRFQKETLELIRDIEENYIDRLLPVRIKTSKVETKCYYDMRMALNRMHGPIIPTCEENQVPISDLQDLYSIDHLAEQLCDILTEDGEFITLFRKYFDLLQEEYFQADAKSFEESQNFFSFKHPFITIIDTLETAVTALAAVPDREEPSPPNDIFRPPKKNTRSYAQKIFDQEIEPLIHACARSYDKHPDSALVKQSSFFADNLNEKIGLEVFSNSLELEKSAHQQSDSQYSGMSLWQKVWSVVSHPQATGFWHNQSGAPSTMARVVKTYSQWYFNRSFRHQTSARTLFRKFLKGNKFLKAYCVQGKYFAELGKVSKPYTLQYESILAHSTESASEQAHHARDEKLGKVMAKYEEANRFVSAFASGIQLLVAAGGMHSYLEKWEKGKLQIEDHVHLIESVSNAGLAITGFTPSAWSKFMWSGAAGFTAVGHACALYFASCDFLEHLDRGEDFLAALNYMAIPAFGVGTIHWAIATWQGALKSGLLATSAIGWMPVVAGIALLLGTMAYELYKVIQPGTYHYFKHTMLALSESEIMSDKPGAFFTETIDVESLLPRSLIVTEDGTYDRLPDHAIHYRVDVELPCIAYKDRWRKYLVWLGEHIRDFGPIDYIQGVPWLVRRGWALEAVLGLMKDGYMVGSSDTKIEREVEDLYAKCKQEMRQKGKGKMSERYREFMAGAEES
jgi:phage tail protein X